MKWCGDLPGSSHFNLRANIGCCVTAEIAIVECQNLLLQHLERCSWRFVGCGIVAPCDFEYELGRNAACCEIAQGRNRLIDPIKRVVFALNQESRRPDVVDHWPQDSVRYRLAGKGTALQARAGRRSTFIGEPGV